jgi:predicted TIM-barrel fold metal-dependent hydrolase
MENERELNEFFEDPYKNTRYISLQQMLPRLDGFHTPRVETLRGTTFDRTVGPEKWLEFLDKTQIEYAVLFPTAGLAYGQVNLPDWAGVYARTYNNWLHAKYLKLSPRFRGMALIPMQDVPAAVLELRRAIKELGMTGAMIPSNGLKRHISAKEFWPVFEEADRLGCVLAIHGGSYSDLGFNTFTVFPPTRALGMPMPLAIAMAGLIADGVFDKFPKLKIGFMEGGTSWIPMIIDRLEREMEYGGLSIKRSPEEYFRSGQVFVGCEGNEKTLAYAIERVGPDPFMFASDFPHEISLDNCMGEINEILERKDIREEHKAAILGDNAKKFYALP